MVKKAMKKENITRIKKIMKGREKNNKNGDRIRKKTGIEEEFSSEVGDKGFLRDQRLLKRFP